MSDDEDNNKDKDNIKKILEGLTAREAKILRERFGLDFEKDHTLAEVGKQYEITRKRIKEIEAKALKKLKRLKNEKQAELTCSFCGKKKSEVKKLIQAESGVTICNECIKTCTDIIENDED